MYRGPPSEASYWEIEQTDEVNELPWAQEIETKINVFNEPIQQFLDVFVRGSGESTQPSKKSPEMAFKKSGTRGKEVVHEKHPTLLKGLRKLVEGFDIDTKPAFSDGRRCQNPSPFEPWDPKKEYAMPDIVMSLPGNTNTQWASEWAGISTVFEVKRDALDDPIDKYHANIKTSGRSTSTLIQISRSARNLLLTHRLLYAFVIGIFHNDKARIFRFDHAAAVVSKAIDLKRDPYPLYDFLWRFCHHQHADRRAMTPPHIVIAPPAVTATRPCTRSTTKPIQVAGIFLGTDPTISAAPQTDCDKIDELLGKSSPPQKLLTKEERRSCHWVAIVAEYNPDGSTKTARWYLAYRLRFLSPRLFSRATRVWEAYEVQEDGQWERRAIKDAWRQLARDREDVLYRRLRDGLRHRDDLEKLVEACKTFGLLSEDIVSGADDTYSEAAPPSTAADNDSESVIHELDDDGTQLLLADELAAYDPLYGLPDVQTGDDLGAREAHKLFDRKCSNSTRSRRASIHTSPSEADLNSLAQGDNGRPPAYDVCHRTICAWLRDKAGAQEARFNERSHVRLVMKTVGRPLSTFKSTKEMVTAIRDAIIGHMLAFKAGLIHRDPSDGNIMIMDDGPFKGLLLDLDYAFNWMEVLELAGEEVSEEAWTAFVEKYNQQVSHIVRPALPEDIPVLFKARGGEPQVSSGRADSRTSWTQRMKMKERTCTLFFTAHSMLTTYKAHDVCHDLESAVWLLLCMVLRHTLQVDHNGSDLPRYQWYCDLFGATTERNSAVFKLCFWSKRLPWKVKGNQPLTDLILKLKKLILRQNCDPEVDEDVPPAVPMTYMSVLTEINRALASPGWPENDAALPFTLFRDDPSSSGPESRGRKRPREEDTSEPQADSANTEGAAMGSDLSKRQTKKPLLETSPLCNETEPNPQA